MSNQVNHRRNGNQKNQRKDERPVVVGGCCGEGHNGQIGRTAWKKLSRRNERRAIKEGRTPRIGKMPSRRFEVREHQTMNNGEISTDSERRKARRLKPFVFDTGEDD